MTGSTLDDMLLEAAGRTNDRKQFSRTPAKRRPSATHNGYSSDESSFSGDQSSSDSQDDDVPNETITGHRTNSGSRMPFKKALDATETDDEEDSGSNSDISFGSDLYKDDEDRKRLAAMTELEREMILHERAEQRDDFLTRKKAEARQRQRQATNVDTERGPPASRIRSHVAKHSPAKSMKENALHELVARRKKAEDTESQRKRWETHERESTRERRRSSSASESEEEEDITKDVPDSSDSIPSEDEKEEEDEEKPTFEDIKSITIRRSSLSKWFLEPFFEEIVVGCFVRIAMGVSKLGTSTYRLYQVRSVDSSDAEKVYTFHNRMTHKYLDCVCGDESLAARWQMTVVSERSPEEIEFLDWQSLMERGGRRTVTKAYVLEKQEAIAKLKSYVYSAAAVKQMLMEKKLAASKPSNFAAEKNRLMKELALAETENDDTKAGKIQTRLQELESLKLQIQAKDVKALALAEMNRKNRFENFKNASDLKAREAAKAGEAGYDPFSRRWTRSRNYYRGDDPQQKAEAENGENTREVEAVATDAVSTADSGVKLVNTEAPVDEKNKMFILHNFNLPISLDGIQKFGGAQGAALAFLARKQRLEATCGVKADNPDANNKQRQALTVNDYKRRRGLL